MSIFKTISYADTGALDAFSRLRVSSPNVMFGVQNQYDASSLIMESGNTGTGVAPSYISNSRMLDLTVTAGTGTSFTQSYQYSPYVPGKSQFIAITGVMGSGSASITKDFGYFDANNGIIYRQNGTSGLQVGIRTSTSGSVVNNFINQSAWNIDTLTGGGGISNKSGITLDVTKTFILIIDLQFLGMGRVRLGFDIDGVVYYVHQFLNANNLTVPYMQTATLPIQALVTATSSAGSGTCYFKCATVQSEGGDAGFYSQNFSTPDMSVNAGNNTRTALLAVRPRTTFNGITNRALFKITDLSLLNAGNAPVKWELMVGVTYSAAPTFTNVSTNYSAFDYSSTNGTYGSGGLIIASGFMSNAANGNATVNFGNLSSFNYPISLDRNGAVRDMGTLSVIVTGIGAASNGVRASIGYTEIK